MLHPARSFLTAALVGLAIGGSTVGFACGDFSELSDAGGGSAVFSGGPSSGAADASSDVSPDSPQPPVGLNYKYLCGEGDCVPGKDIECTPEPSDSTAVSGTGANGTGSNGTGSNGTGSGSSGSGSMSTGSGSGSSGSGSMSTSGGELTSGAGGASSTGASGSGPGGAPTEYGCGITFDNGKPVSECLPSGEVGLHGPCQSSDHCAPGLACVDVAGMSGVGQCLRFCCGKLEDCPEGTFCNPRRFHSSPIKRIPVCEQAFECPLLTVGACPEGKACTVVRANGTTSCVDPGEGKTCDPCPCSDGYVCNPDLNQCKKLCHTDSPANECGGGSCQGGTGNYPKGIGICVGGDSVCH